MVNKNIYLFGAIFCLLFNACAPEEEAGPIDPRRMEVLFLGHDSEHHNAQEFLPYLASSLTPRGINFTYTNEVSDLNRNYLKHFDAVAIYANIDEIPKSEERAIMNFVKNGGGLIPIHSASYCFRNSSQYVDLVGGQFSSHDTARFSLHIVDPNHQITMGLDPFETWDETYIHEKHSDKHILMTRVDGDHEEPYTWIKEYGKGRMFYTALGHDLRTWGQTDFHELLFRGICWAIGDRKKEALDKWSAPLLAYSAAKIANYEKRDPAPELQAPLSPEESMQHIQIPPEFELQLFASEPDVINPIALNWDEKGRLWILETVDYPNDIKLEKGVGNDRIKILEDTDGDGKADSFTIFADKLSVPTSLVFSNGGVIVSQAPHFLFLKDTDGDDKADVREILIDGWGTYDTHAGPSNLKYGFDNRIWGVVGYSGFEATLNGEAHDFDQAIYSFTPDGTDIDHISRTSNNTWGLGISEANDIFISTANNTHSGYYGIPEKHINGVKGIHLRGVQKIDGHYLFHPITRNFRQVDVFGGFTAAAGHSLYTARAFPKEYWNSIAFVAEPTGHLLHNAILKQKGAGFTEHDGWNLLASSDEWVSPVAAEVGPDGAVWIADWYNFIIQHNPTPTGFENGFGNAHVNPLRDKQRGRIYRLSFKGAPTYEKITLDIHDPNQLLAALDSDNMLWRMHAQRLLVERGETDVIDRLLSKIDNSRIDKESLNPAALHSIWTLHGLGVVNDGNTQILSVLDKALQNPAASVRKAAMQVLPVNEKTFRQLYDSGILNDKDGPTRLAALNKLWELPTSDALSDELIRLTTDESVNGDLWLRRATYLACVKHKDSFVEALSRDNPNFIEDNGLAAKSKISNFSGMNVSTDDWGDIDVPKWLGHTGIEELTDFVGEMWYRKHIELDANQVSAGNLQLAGVSTYDSTFVNGILIGNGEGWNTQRNYKIPNGVLQAGINSISIKASFGGGMGVDGDMFLESGGQKTDLSGKWKYAIETVRTSAKSEYADGDNIVSLFLKNYGDTAAGLDTEGVENEIADKSFVIKSVKDKMAYDITKLKASPGDLIEIRFVNEDAMQHNLLLVKPGKLALVGSRAEEFAKVGDAAAADYVPPMNDILFASPLLNPGEEAVLKIRIPDRAGDYPYVCTFPGHWQTMNGIIVVRAES